MFTPEFCSSSKLVGYLVVVVVACYSFIDEKLEYEVVNFSLVQFLDHDVIGEVSVASIKECKQYVKQVRAMERDLEVLRRKHKKVKQVQWFTVNCKHDKYPVGFFT